MCCVWQLWERGVSQQRPVSGVGFVGLRLSQQCLLSFIYFKDEMDGEEHKGKTASGHCSSARVLSTVGETA